MSKFLCITVRFLQPLSHSRGAGGEPEWPPAPLRVFQAMVAAAAAHWNERTRLDYAVPALEWLAKQPAPTVIAAVGVPSDVKYRLYVPDNVADKVAGAWKRGTTSASIADYRTEKDVRPTHLVGDAVHYLYSIAEAAEFAKHRDTLITAARSVTHLGWGVDMVAGNAAEVTEEEVAKLTERGGERWQPTPAGSGTPLRVPRDGTLAALMDKHAAFLNRLDAGGFRPVPPLTAFNVVSYRRDTDLAERPVAVFELHRTVAELAELPAGKSRFRPFDPVRTPQFARTGGHDPCGTVIVAGMVRHAVGEVAKEQGWPQDRIKTFVQGHGDEKNGQATTDDRLMFLPLPSITPLKVEDIRRVLVVGPPGEDLSRLRQLLNGRELFPEKQKDPVAVLAVCSRSDPVASRYLTRSATWSTVTPVVLPGYDDATGVRRRLSIRETEEARVEHQKDGGVAKQWEALNRSVRDLLLKAFAHVGIGPGLLSVEQLDRGDAALEWRENGFVAGVDLARRYHLVRRDKPNTPQFPRYHVRVRFAHPIVGPLAVGAGRYRGLGLFAAE